VGCFAKADEDLCKLAQDAGSAVQETEMQQQGQCKGITVE
jgi:hypothetical protein